MKVNELRVGNLVCKFDRVISVDSSTIAYIEQREAIDTTSVLRSHTHINPIRITTDWLQTFGDINLYEFTHDDDTKEFQFRFKNLFFKVKYVHQLQNLFYVLEGKELQLKSIPILSINDIGFEIEREEKSINLMQ